jgi:uncharacterized membrane protein
VSQTEVSAPVEPRRGTSAVGRRFAALKPQRISWTKVLLWGLMLAYAGWMSWLSIRQHEAFFTHRMDLGHYDQTIWNSLHGRLLIRTNDAQQVLSFTDHVEPILVPISLIYLIWNDVKALLVLQSIALALGALPVFWLARDELRNGGLGDRAAEWAALGLGLVYLLFPSMQAANLTEFHPATLAVAPMLLATYYARRARYGPMWLWALVVLCVKEEMSLLVLMLALWLLVSRRQWKHGGALAALSLAWFYVTNFVIAPMFNPIKFGLDQWVFIRYRELGDTPLQVLRSLLVRPDLVWSILAEPGRARYVWGMLVSAGLILPLLAPDMLILGLPILLANLLGDYDAMYSGLFHYSAALVPSLMAASAVGLGRTYRLFRRWNKGQVAMLIAAALALTVSLGYHRVYGHTPLAQDFVWPEVTAHHRLLEERFAPQIPRDAVLATTAPLFPHLDHRERIHQLPIVDDATWVLLDAATGAEMAPGDLKAAYDALVASGSWCIVDAADGYLLLTRDATAAKDCTRQLPDAFYSFARAGDAQPEVRVDAGWGALRLLGYEVTSVTQWKRVGVRLYWTLAGEGGTAPAAPEGLQIRPFWLGEGGKVVENWEVRPVVEPLWYPPSRWQPGEVVVTEMLPGDLGPAFCLGLAVVDAAGRRLPVQVRPVEEPAYPIDGATWLRLGAFRWEGNQVIPVEEGAAPTHPLEVQFGESVALLGFDLTPAEPQPGGRLNLQLHWQALQPIDRDWTVFVHVLDETGQRVAQADGPPNYLGALPTTLWQVGVPVLDLHSATLPDRAGPATYSIQIGWYDPQTGERLPLSTGGDSLSLGQIRVH